MTFEGGQASDDAPSGLDGGRDERDAVVASMAAKTASMTAEHVRGSDDFDCGRDGVDDGLMVAMIIMESMVAVTASMAAILLVLILTPDLMVDDVSRQR